MPFEHAQSPQNASTKSPQNEGTSRPKAPQPYPRGNGPQLPPPKPQAMPTSAMGAIPAMSTVFSSADAEAVVRELLAQGVTDVNAITNEVFWRSREDLRGQKLAKGSAEANEWVDIRDYSVKPVLAAQAPQESPLAPIEDTPAVDDAASGEAETTTAGAGAAAPKIESKGASGANPYYNQNDNTFEDSVGGTWANGSAGMNTCNMTSLTMALVGMAGDEAVVKDKLAAYLRTKTLRDGSKVKIDGKWHTMDKVLSDPKLLNAVQVEDLVIAAGVQEKAGKKVGYSAVTTPTAIMAVAKKSGLVGKATYMKGGEDDLSKPDVREKAKAMLGAGQKLIGGTVNHYVYITAIRDDGVVVHDPAGARVAASGKPQFMHPGQSDSKLSTWLSGVKDPTRRATFQNRANGNPELQKLVDMLIVANDAEGKDAKKDAKTAIKTAFPGVVNTGANNFYAIDEMKTFNLRVRVSLEAKAPTPAQKTDAPGE